MRAPPRRAIWQRPLARILLVSRQRRNAMTSLTFDDFPAPVNHRRRMRRTGRVGPTTPAGRPGVPPARAAAAAPPERSRWPALALVAAIAGLHAGAIATFAGAGKQTARVPVAVSIALAPQRLEAPPPPPPPPKPAWQPPRARAVTPAPQPQPQRLAAAPASNLAPSPPSPDSVAAAEPAPAPAPAQAPAPAAGESLIEPRGYAGYLRNPAPAYPPMAQRRGLEGQAVLKVHVLATGQPDSVTVARSSGHAILDEAAVKAVVSWAFAPARRGHTAVDGWVQVPLTFKI
jgi:protein TonB